MRIAGWFGCALFVCAVGCDVGDGAEGGGDENLIPPGGTEPVLLCEATLSITGSLAPAGATPGPDDGCVPEGIWTLNVTVEDDGGCAEVPINAVYEYEVTRDADEVLQVAYLGSDGGDGDFLKPGSAGGTCRLTLNHFDYKGVAETNVLLHAFEDDLVVTGDGTYEVWE